MKVESPLINVQQFDRMHGSDSTGRVWFKVSVSSSR